MTTPSHMRQYPSPNILKIPSHAHAVGWALRHPLSHYGLCTQASGLPGGHDRYAGTQTCRRRPADLSLKIRLHEHRHTLYLHKHRFTLQSWRDGLRGVDSYPERAGGPSKTLGTKKQTMPACRNLSFENRAHLAYPEVRHHLKARLSGSGYTQQGL